MDRVCAVGSVWNFSLAHRSGEVLLVMPKSDALPIGWHERHAKTGWLVG